MNNKELTELYNEQFIRIKQLEAEIECLETELDNVRDAHEKPEADNLRFIKANAEVAKINADLVEENEALGMALDYYKTGAQQTPRDAKRPKYVPKRIILDGTIRSELPLSNLVAPPGEYEVYCNQYGAVSLRTLGGELLGVKLDEFEVVKWQENPALLTGELDTTSLP